MMRMSRGAIWFNMRLAPPTISVRPGSLHGHGIRVDFGKHYKGGQHIWKLLNRIRTSQSHARKYQQRALP